MDDNLHSTHGKQELIHNVNQYTLSILSLSKDQARDILRHNSEFTLLYMCQYLYNFFPSLCPHIFLFCLVLQVSLYLFLINTQLDQKLRDGLSNVERNHAYRICYNSSAEKIKLRSFSCDQVDLVLFRSRFHVKLLEKNLWTPLNKQRVIKKDFYIFIFLFLPLQIKVRLIVYLISCDTLK